jgi:hypothetical protein
MSPRETYYSSVFAFFSALTVGGSPAFKVATRKLQTWNDVAQEDQPAILMQQRTETAQYRKGVPTVWTFNIALLIYVATGAQNDPTIIPAQILNPLLDSIQAALTIDDLSNQTCTLGGIVSHCAFDGPIEIVQGDMGDEAVAIVPISVFVPA